MAKINILFDEVNYKVEDTSMSEHSNELKTHISTVMNGSGSAVKFGGTSYNIDSTKLSNTTNDFVSHLGTIAGSGHKVVVGGTQYNASSEKLTSAIDELHAILSGLHSEDEDSDLGEINEYGFYYDTKYSNYSGGEGYFYFRENQTAEFYAPNYHETFAATYSDNFIDVPDFGASFEVISDGKELFSDSMRLVFKIGDAVIVDGDYTYGFSCIVGSYRDIQNYGWTVYVNDKTKSSYGAIRTDRPEGYPLLLNNTFMDCINLTVSPEIPDSVVSMKSAFNGCINLTTAPVIPSSVTDMSDAFYYCQNLETAPVIPSNVERLFYTFGECINLTGNVEVNGEPLDTHTTFYGTVKPIVITGSCSEETKRELAESANNGNVTY